MTVKELQIFKAEIKELEIFKAEVIKLIQKQKKQIANMQKRLDWQDYYIDYVRTADDELHDASMCHAMYLTNSSKTYEL